jgi:hypothetical protein
MVRAAKNIVKPMQDNDFGCNPLIQKSNTDTVLKFYCVRVADVKTLMHCFPSQTQPAGLARGVLTGPHEQL